MLQCEEFALKILPAVRSILSRKLYYDYGKSQREIAKILGLTQAAVSQYVNKRRGSLVEDIEKDDEIKRLIDLLVLEILNGNEGKNIYCEICKRVREKLSK